MHESVKKSLVILIYFALALSILLVFWQARNFDFINYDDNHYVSANPHVLTGLTFDNVIWAFTTGQEANWHPLTWLSYMFDCSLFGPRPGLMHLENVFLHLANTLLLFAVLKKMTDTLWPSAFVAALFALHPMHVQSVAWIAERKDVLSTLFWMLTLLAYASYVKRPTAVRYVAALVIFALGLMAKPMLVTLPFVLLLLDYWPLSRFDVQTANTSGRYRRKSIPDRRAVLYKVIIEKIPFFILSAVSSTITFLVQQSSGTVADINILPLQSRIANAFLSYAKYMGKLFWPQNLAVLYPLNISGIVFWQAAICALLLLGISFFVIYFRQARRYLPIGWFWFVGTLIPVIGLVQVGTQSLADRYTYIPYVGLFIMLAWSIPELLSGWSYRKIAVGILMPIVIIAVAVCAYHQVSYWNNSTTLFSRAIEVTQNNYVAHCNLAKDLRNHGKTVLAIEHFRKAYQIAPNYPDTVNGLGAALFDHGDIDQAIEYFQKAIQVKPESPYPRNNLGFAFEKQGKLNEAVTYFTQAVQLKPDWPEPTNALAWLIATHPEIKNRDINEAIYLAGRACELTSNKNPAFLATLAAAYAAAGRFPEAVDTAHKAVTIADAANQPHIKETVQHQLTFYTQHKPYIEPPPNSK
jgi:Flp pilus assembly protein TadD